MKKTSVVSMFSVAALLSAFVAGCDKQEPVQPSRPAARTPNKTSESSPTASAAPAVPGQPNTPAGATAGTDNARVEMGTRSTAVTPTTAPSSGATEASMPRSDPAAAPAADSTVAEFAGFSAPKPATWQWRKPSNSMRVAEYSVPGVDGADQAAVVVFSFPGGGTVQANVDRWKTQFRRSDGTAIEPKVQTIEAGDAKVTVVEIAGEYRGMGKSDFTPDQLFISGILETDDDPVFVQLVGPTKTVEANREAFMSLLRGVKRSEPMK